ncbi:MAG: hypothetical protein WBD51_02050, partial [Burkholderiaceae bacterium]
EQTGERWWESQVHLLRAQLHLSNGDSLEAVPLLQKSIEVAREQKAKSWELRSTITLSRLWAEQDRRLEAIQLLSPLYGWFTEGFDSADLKEAKSLLDELG